MVSEATGTRGMAKVRYLIHMLNRAARYVTRAGLGIMVVAALVMVTPAPSHAAVVAPADGYGFGQGAAPLVYSVEDTNRELDAVTKTNASWLRVLIDWSNIERSKGQFDWGYLDNVVNAAGARNLKVLGVIAYTPAWARSGGPMTSWTAPPTDPADFAGFAGTVVQRYGDRISNWEIWNEPNLPLFFGIFTDRKVERYTELLKAAYPAIKAVQPGSSVVAAGLSRWGSPSPPVFLEQMYGAGAGGFFDAAAAHPYVFPGGLTSDSREGWSDVGRMRDVMVANGDGGKKIWMTEIGAPTSNGGVSQEEQAKQITDVLAAAAQTGYSGPAFIYSIRDVDTADRGNKERNYGALLTSDWQPKIMASVLAR
jgi:hypothetical protein